jgi:hypothetical protein
VTTRGEAYRNASVRELVEHAPRGSVKVSKKEGWSVEVLGAAPAPAQGFATDVMAGRQVMDVEEFEAKLRSVRRPPKNTRRARRNTLRRPPPPSLPTPLNLPPFPSAQIRTDSLSYAPQLFVEDAAVGSSRLAEVRVRVITDSPVVALYVRTLLHRTPLYNPQAFPRTVTVYAATLAGPGVAAAEGTGPYTVVDVDPATKAGTVLAVGNVALASIAESIAAAAGQLALTGGYRSVPGGNKHPGIAAARADGVLSWYMRDGHYYAPAGDAHPDLLPLAGDVIAEADGKGYAAVLGAAGSGGVAGAAAAKGRLYAAHNFVWTAEQGVASTWAGVTLPAAAAKGAAVGKGALVAQGGVTAALTGPRAVPHPTRVIVVGGSGADAAAKAKSAAGLSDAQAEKLAARLAASKAQVVTVATAADALKALGL